MSDQKQFKPGDLVKWTSQAGGKGKTKIGKVVLVVPANRALSEFSECFLNSVFCVRARFAATRSHESYVVWPHGSRWLYWPLVKYLELAESSRLPESNQAQEPENKAEDN